MSLADTDGDGKMNIIVPDYKSDTVVFRQTPTGDWQKWPLSGNMGSTRYIELEDTDSDGVQEIYFYNNTANGENNAHWDYNTTSGAYEYSQTSTGIHFLPQRNVT